MKKKSKNVFIYKGSIELTDEELIYLEKLIKEDKRNFDSVNYDVEKQLLVKGILAIFINFSQVHIFLTETGKSVVRSINFEKKTIEEKTDDIINHYPSEVVDDRYFKSYSGDFFVGGDIRITCLLKIDEMNYKQVYIKASEIGVLYRVIGNKSDLVLIIEKI